MNGTNHCISVDWGTSRFRLRQVDIDSAEISKAHQTDMGIKTMYNNWLATQSDRTAYYLDYLIDQLNYLKIPAAAPVIISGMASSSIGLQELPYAPLPFACNGTGLHVEKLKYKHLRNVFLVSGVCGEADVIRGEETELLGVYEEHNEDSKNCYVFPGTHSKHMICQNGWVVDFRTYMTGEFFDVVRKHTILGASIAQTTETPIDAETFAQGVNDAQQGNLLNHLFKIRANELLHQQSKEKNGAYLSGLLIGYELSHLGSLELDQIKLCAQNQLADLYKMAANEMNISLNELSSKRLEKATVLGQLKLLKLFLKPSN